MDIGPHSSLCVSLYALGNTDELQGDKSHFLRTYEVVDGVECTELQNGIHVDLCTVNLPDAVALGGAYDGGGASSVGL